MVLTKAIKGKTICLRYAEPSDAAFIISLRIDERRNKYLSAVDDDVQKQVIWLINYKKRERSKQEYYFIIEKLDGTALGTVRIYDFQSDSFSWGSWVIIPNAPASVAIESALLVYEFAFYHLNFLRSHFEVLAENKRVIAFHIRFGAKLIQADDVRYFFNYSCKDYEKIRVRYQRFLKKE